MPQESGNNLKDQVRVAMVKARLRAGDRVGRALGQPEFARVLSQRLGRNIRPDAVSDWERGKHEPGASVLVAAAQVAGVDLDALFGPRASEDLARLRRDLDGMASSSET